MLARLTLLISLVAAVGCSGGEPSTGTTASGTSATGGATSSGTGASGTTSGSSTSGSTNVAAFLGTYNCVYAGSYELTGTTTMVSNPAYSATIVVAAGTSTDLEITGLSEGGTTGCLETLDVTSSTTATFSPAEQSCTYTDPTNGNHQTNTRTGVLTVTPAQPPCCAASETLTLNGTFTGTTSSNSSYSGTYSGIWTCTPS